MKKFDQIFKEVTESLDKIFPELANGLKVHDVSIKEENTSLCSSKITIEFEYAYKPKQ